MRRPGLATLCAVVGMAAGAEGQEGPRTRLRGYLSAEPRLFPQDARSPGQDALNASLAAELELRHQWHEDARSLVFTPFLRLDASDAERTHVDVREASLRVVGSRFELVAGVSKVFWGVTESQHLVDVVNQTDLVENPDGEEKLGQLMLNLLLARRWGTLSVFVLPGARERTFPGQKGRLGTSVPVHGDAVFEGGRWHVDLAARWSMSTGPFDVGVSHFYGTSREPRLVSGSGTLGEARLVPHYDLIHQTGLDSQLTAGRWLWKLEAIHRSGPGPRHLSATFGFEYTVANLGGSGADLGLLAEYLYDERQGRAPTPWQDDVFAGLRLTRGDAQSSELLAGVIVDRRSGAMAWSLEASRRLGQRGKLGLEARFFGGSRQGDPLFELQRDDYLQLSLAHHF